MLDVDRFGTVFIECLFFKLCNQRDSCFVADILFFKRGRKIQIFSCVDILLFLLDLWVF